MSAPASRSAAFLLVVLGCGIVADSLLRRADVVVRRTAVHSPQPPAALRVSALRPGVAIPSGAADAIRAALERHGTLHYEARSIEDILDEMRMALGINVVIDRPTIADERIQIDELVRLKVTDVTWRSVLELLLEPYQLDWTIENEVLFVSTAVRCREHLTTRACAVGDLVRNSTAGPWEFDFTGLIDVIITNVMPESWDSFGGPGSLRPVHAGAGTPILVVRQTRRGLEAVEQLLADLRTARRSRSSVEEAGSDPILCLAPNARRRREQEIRNRLETRHNFEYTEVPVLDALRDLESKLGVDLVIDTVRIEDERIDLKAPISLMVNDITVRSALNLIVRPLQLNWVVRNEVLFVSTSVYCSDLRPARVYDVTDLVMIEFHGVPIDMPDFTELIDMISSTIDPENWDTSGPSPVRPLIAPGIHALVIRQMDEVHEKIAALLAEMVRLQLTERTVRN